MEKDYIYLSNEVSVELIDNKISKIYDGCEWYQINGNESSIEEFEEFNLIHLDLPLNERNLINEYIYLKNNEDEVMYNQKLDENKINFVSEEAKEIFYLSLENESLEKENQQLKEDISFCLKSIKQEMEMSTDSRIRQEMLSCYQILSKWSDK